MDGAAGVTERELAPPADRRQSGGLMAWAGGRWAFLLIVAAGLAIRLALSPFGSFENDVLIFGSWAERLTTEPFDRFYDAPFLVDHLPGDLWILWGVARVHRLFSPEAGFGGFGFLFLIKLVPSLFDIAIALLLARLGGALGGPRAALLAAGAWALNPAPIFLSAIWGQWDAVSACFALAAVCCFLPGPADGEGAGRRLRPEWALPLLAYASLVKPPLFALAPVLGLVYLRSYVLPHTRFARYAGGPCGRADLRRAAVAAGLSFGIVLAVLLPFGVGLPGMPTRWGLFERAAYAARVYETTTLNAFNLWALPFAGNFRPDTPAWVSGLSYAVWGTLLFGAAYLLVLARLWRTRGYAGLLWACTAVSLSAFVLPTRVHERYLFPAVLFAVALAAAAPRYRWLAGALSLSYGLNLYWVYDLYYRALELEWMRTWAPFQYAASALNVGLLLWLLLHGPDRAPAPADAAAGGRPVSAARRPFLVGERPELAGWRARLVPLGGVLLVAAALGLFLPALGHPGRYVYDEVYHAYTAGQYAANNADAWVWWTKAPVLRVAYEWTHPPLGKLLLAGGVLAWGDDPWGWRVASALFGAAGVALLYALALRASGSRAVALVAAGLLLLDGLYFVQARRSMLDVFGAVFVLGALLAFLGYLRSPAAAWTPAARRSLLLTGLLLGLALATKWNAAYAAALVGLVALWRALGLWRASRRGRRRAEAGRALREHLVWLPVALGAVPLGVYLLAYLPFFLYGYSPAQWIELQRQMLYYHTHLESTHAYQSSWWSWPFALRPVWYWVERAEGGIANVYANGNPFLYWAFLPALAYVCGRWVRERPAALGVLLLGFLGQWLPWGLSPRLAYIYHFLPSVPFGCLAVAVALVDGWRRGGPWRLIAAGYGAAVVFGFLYFYPLWAGLPLPPADFEARLWLESWR